MVVRRVRTIRGWSRCVLPPTQRTRISPPAGLPPRVSTRRWLASSGTLRLSAQHRGRARRRFSTSPIVILLSSSPLTVVCRRRRLLVLRHGICRRQITVKTTSGLSDPRTDRLFIGIEATDSGRLGTEIQHFGFQLPNKHHIQALADFVGQPVNLPMALGPGRTVTMRYNPDKLRAALASQGISGENVRPYVVTGAWARRGCGDSPW